MRIATFFNHETLMHQVALRREGLPPDLAWYEARLSFVAAFLMMLLRGKTTNASKLVTTFSIKAQTNCNAAFASMNLMTLKLLKPLSLRWQFQQRGQLQSIVPSSFSRANA